MYQHGRRPRRTKNPRVYLQAAALLGISLIVVAWILHKDLSVGSEEKSTLPIVTEVSAAQDTITIDTQLFTMQLPSDWVESNRVNNPAVNYIEWRSTKQGGNERMLRVYIDVLPVDYKIVKLLPVTVDGRTLRTGNLSGTCANFAKDTAADLGDNGIAAVEAKWESITFVCDPINGNQTIGTGTVEGGIAAKMSTSFGDEHKFFLYWQDHNIRPDDLMFQNIVKSFNVK